jgi:hypothetical protein
MVRLIPLVVLLVACAGSKPRPEPVQQCPAPPRIVTPEEVKAAGANRDAYDDAYIRLEDLLALSEKKIREALDELRVLETRACACPDAACATAIQEDFEAWARRHADTQGSQSQADEAGRIAEHISECMVKVMQ